MSSIQKTNSYDAFNYVITGVTSTASQIIQKIQEVASSIISSIGQAISYSINSLGYAFKASYEGVSKLFSSPKEVAPPSTPAIAPKVEEKATSNQVTTELTGSYNLPTEAQKTEFADIIKATARNLIDSTVEAIKEKFPSQEFGFVKIKALLASGLGQMYQTADQYLPTEEQRSKFVAKVKSEATVILERIAQNAKLHNEKAPEAEDSVDSGTFY